MIKFNNTVIRRIVYFIGGLAFIVMAIKDHTWWIGLFGLYFMAMSVFKFGCASGNCTSSGCELPEEQKKLEN